MLTDMMQIAVSSTEHPQLLEGLRGAGTTFGVVTELTLQLFSTADVYAGYLTLPDDSNFTNFRYIITECPPIPLYCIKC